MADPLVPPPPEGFTIDTPAAPASVAPIIARTPAPQTPAQSQKDVADADKAQSDAAVSAFKVKEEGLTEGKQQAQKDMTTAGVDNLVSSIEGAKKLVSGWSTGLPGAALQQLGATDAAKLKAVIDQEIKGNVFLTTLQQRQQDSPNGTGSTPGGRVLQSEVPMITGALGTLDPVALGSEMTTEKLNQIAYRALRAKAIINGDDPNDPKVQHKYGIDKYAAALPPTDVVGGGPPPSGDTPPAAPSGPGTPQGTQHFRVKAPDGHVYEFDAPANATPQQLDALTRAAAGAPKDYPVKSEGVGGQLLDATKNDLAGIAQGAAALPDMAATAVGKVASVIPTAVGYGLDKLGFNNAATHAYGIAHDLANPLQIGNGIESIAPTPNNAPAKAGRFVGQMVGGGLGFPGSAAESMVAKVVGEVPKGFVSPAETAAKVAPTIAGDAKQAGVRLMTSDVSPPTTFIGKAAQAIGERIPITGTGGARAAQQAERINAVKSAAQDFGAATGDELSSPAIDSVAQDLAARRGAELTRLTSQKNAVIDKVQGAVSAPDAISAIDQQISRLSGINNDAYAPVIAKLQSFRDQLASGKSLSQIEGNRKLLADMFSDPSLASVKTDGEKALNAIYGPLRQDMGNFIKANGEPGDFARWQGANDGLAGMVGDLKNAGLKKALNTADITPENTASLLFSQKPSDVRLLYSGLSPAGRAKAQAAIIQRAVEKSGGMENLSPDRFANQITSLGKSVGVFFQDNDAARIEGLARVLNATKRAAQASVSPPTGVQAVPYAMGAGFTEAFGIPGGLSAAFSTGLLARAYESAPVRNILLKLGQSKSGSPQESALLERAGTAIAAAAAQKHAATSTVLNDNVPSMGAAAASPNGGPDQQQQANGSPSPAVRQ